MNSAELISLVLRTTPLVFSLVLDLLPVRYIDQWDETANQTNSAELAFNQNKSEPYFKKISVYVFDRLRISYTVAISLFYMGILYLVAVITSETLFVRSMYGIPAAVFFGLAPISYITVRIWFTASNRSPSRYYEYHIETEGEDQDRIQDRFMFLDSPRFDRIFSPRKAAILSQILLIIVAVVLQVTSMQAGVISGSIAALILIGFGRLIFPR